MKKALSFLLISILVLSGSGVFALENEKSQEINDELPSDIEFVLRGGLGVNIKIINRGSQHYYNTGWVAIRIVSLLWDYTTLLKIPDPLPLNEWVKLSTIEDRFIFGFGISKVSIDIDLDDDDLWDICKTKYGLLFGPFFIIGRTKVI